MGTTTDYAARLGALRERLAAENLDGLLVPMADEYQSEYVPASARRIEFLSGFTGSAGFIAVLKDKAAFFTDGRYTLQAQQQVPAALFGVYRGAVTTPGEWLCRKSDKGARLAYDPWLHTEKRRAVEKGGGQAGAETGPATRQSGRCDLAIAAPRRPSRLFIRTRSPMPEKARPKASEIAAELRKEQCGLAR